jgi:hypothetical protein
MRFMWAVRAHRGFDPGSKRSVGICYLKKELLVIVLGHGCCSGRGRI